MNWLIEVVSGTIIEALTEIIATDIIIEIGAAIGTGTGHLESHVIHQIIPTIIDVMKVRVVEPDINTSASDIDL